MEKDKLNALKDKLNDLISKNAKYEEIYEVSKEVDKQIVEYYRSAEN